MRSEVLLELFRNGFSFISERFLSHAPAKEPPSTSRAALTVDRIKSPSLPSSEAFLQPPPEPSSLFSPEYHITWRDDPYDYITPAGLEAVASLLRAWGDDITAGNVSCCQDSGPIAMRFDSGNYAKTRLSIVVHNLMLELYGYNTQQTWQETRAEMSRAIKAAEAWISVFYSSENLDVVRLGADPPYEQLGILVEQYWSDKCALCEVASFFAFAILQTDQWGHPGMQLPQISMMKMLVDLEAFHRHQPIPSFIHITRENHPPGYLYNDGGMSLEVVTAKQLHDIWHYHRRDCVIDSRHSKHARPCRVWPNGENVIRRAKLVSAAAASLKSARRYADGSRPMRISPLPSLLYVRYRRTPDAAGLYTHNGPIAPKDQATPAKRKAHIAAPDSRRPKRARSSKDLISEIERVRAMEVAAAAAIPLPPSPAATEPGSDDGGEKATAIRTDGAQPQRFPWHAMFPEDEAGVPRLRISSSKAEELRIIAEEKRAVLQVEKSKREEELRRREEQRQQKEEAERLAKSGLRAPTRQVIAPLPESWHSRVNAATRADPRKEVAKSPEGTALRSSDFSTVVSKSEWLNDEIVNGFLLHLANYINIKAGIMNPKTQTPRCHAFTSFFWKALSTKGATGTERWMKRVGITRDNFLDVETILIPICEHNHWTLVVVRPRQVTVTHLDSMGNGAGRRLVLDIMMRWLRDYLKEKYSDRWRVQPLASPRQTNGWDCGVHTITNALFVSLGLDPSFYGAREMPLQRDRIAATLINGGFSGELDLAGL